MDYPFDVRDVIISDPCILADPVSKKYYTYASVFNPDRYPDMVRGQGFYAIVSEDLLHWSDPIKVFDRASTGFPFDKDYWAPECHYWNGMYYLISTFRAEGKLRRCCILRAESPLGPFEPLNNGTPVTPEGWNCLDGTLYTDAKGKPWLVFCHEWVQVGDGQVATVPLSDDLSTAIGPPEILFRASAAPWACNFMNDVHSGFVTDGPYLYTMEDGSLLMLWSNFCQTGYATGYAKSASGTIHGPWIQQKNPLYFLDGAHSMLFKTFDGRLMMSLHCNNTIGEKHIMLFEMEDKNGELYIVNEITGNWYNWAQRDKQKMFTDPYTDHRGL